MKTNSLARRLAKARAMVIVLALLGLVTAEFRLGESLATRFGQAAASPAEYPQVPPLGLADLMAAAPH